MVSVWIERKTELWSFGIRFFKKGWNRIILVVGNEAQTALVLPFVFHKYGIDNKQIQTQKLKNYSGLQDCILHF